MRVMVHRRLMQRRPHLPRAPGSEHSKNPKENPSQLQPQLPRQLHKRPPHRLAEALAALFQPFPCLSHLRCRSRSLLSQPNPEASLSGRPKPQSQPKSKQQEAGAATVLCFALHPPKDSELSLHPPPTPSSSQLNALQFPAPVQSEPNPYPKV